MTSFNDPTFAQRFRDWAKGVIQDEIEKVWPRPRTAIVKTIDRPNLKATVVFSSATGEPEVPVKMGSVQPLNVDQNVLVAGPPGNKYILLVFGPAYYA